jgi:hypothetical protein
MAELGWNEPRLIAATFQTHSRFVQHPIVLFTFTHRNARLRQERAHVQRVHTIVDQVTRSLYVHLDCHYLYILSTSPGPIPGQSPPLAREFYRLYCLCTHPLLNTLQDPLYFGGLQKY